MTWENMSRMLQATDQLTPTQQISFFHGKWKHSRRRKQTFFGIRILDKDKLEASNSLGLAKAKKWMAKVYGIFDDEIDGLMYAHGDLGEAIYHLDSSTKSNETFTVQYVHRLLNMNCGNIDSNEFEMIEESILAMSANARRWFIRYMLRTPRNGINEGTVAKIIAKHYNKKQADVKKHLNFNSVEVSFSSL